MTTFTGPVHVRASADAPTANSALPSGALGFLSLVSAGGTSNIVLTTAGNPANVTAITSAGGRVMSRGFVKLYVEGTVAQIPFWYSTT
jgi:hypothetical protein